MKRYFLNLGLGALAFAAVVSCKNGEEREVDDVAPVGEIEATSDNISGQQVSGQETKELENTQLVPSGTYTGEAIIVDSQQKEVYVRLNDTTTIELYFSNDTQIMRNGEQVQFDALQQGQTLEVEVERSGESLKPKRVSIK
ncbi:hypothetical protein [Salinimicrobium xinjiangense]|uniref:hypothetical protein n=1 Tax=Salinimicrobium xinjiangense TaxID=438596 RepID=UPI00042101BD|nr:hypothetical protein [Salinimicrobium xinjiangense]